ncbi:lantibiotic dehydratase [Catellatospora bangladeshensis]|uniref:Lantibiotic dehydratase n=1 Tax=Catellatospora bangladeshensis TaxID=310355 RepID=A0A8J3JMX6_9ACTN|nr:lantibiotic dehydratase [Catellatospora bangladeshensis]GIF80869.1 hypothetical protein Cba03nite_22180 [Catellatospora bangladeshensis]
MPPARTRFRPVGPLLVRTSTDPGIQPDPTASLAVPIVDAPAAIDWLAKSWEQPHIREAISTASPDLALRVGQILAAPADTDVAAARRASLALASYLLRWRRRTTPFGLFAAVTTAATGPAEAKIGDRHRAIARVDADWLAIALARLGQSHDLRRRLSVTADSAATVRDGRVIVNARPEAGSRKPGTPRETSTTLTPAVRLVLQHAAKPIPFSDLLSRVAAAGPSIAPARIEALLHRLISSGHLITSLQPPLTAVDGLAHVLRVLDAAGADDISEIAPTVKQLRDVHMQLARHNSADSPADAATIRASVTETMAGIAPGTEHQLAIDLHLDAHISVPQQVIDEAARAAAVLLQISTQPFGSISWLDYHARFRDRYGPGALVAVRDLVADSGLGYPAGFLGAPRARPSWRAVTERDVHLMALIQRALLDGTDEIELTDADIDALTTGDHATVVPPSRVELGFAVYAASCEALAAGDFALQVTGAPRTPTSMAGRFAYLLDPTDQQQVAASFAVGTSAEAMTVQMSFPPRRIHNENVTRVGQLLPDVMTVSEYADTDVITVDDLAVTADAEQLYLAHKPTGRMVIPRVLHALDLVVQTPPLARFIAEVAEARSAVFGPLDLGAAARNLPYVPRIRYRRTLLTAGRWLLSSTDITPTITDSSRWTADLRTWRRRWRVPARVVLCHGEVRQPLDLDQPLDRELLRHRLTQVERLELREDAPEDGFGWIGRPAEFLTALTPATPPIRRLPVTATPGGTSQPGAADIVHARLVGTPARFDTLLTDHLPSLAARLTQHGVDDWWVTRHRDTIRVEADQHLSLFLRLDPTAAYATIAAKVAEFAAGLAAGGLPAELTFTAYHRHTGRYGEGPAMLEAERVFATDTAAAIAQIRTAEQLRIEPAGHITPAMAEATAQALAAVSMTRLAAALAEDPATGWRALLTCLENVTQPASRALTELARRLADPGGEHHFLQSLPGGEAIAESWQHRDIAVERYRACLLPQRDPLTVLRSLLHEHHVRAVGVDPEFERATNHAARAAAMLCLAKAARP